MAQTQTSGRQQWEEVHVSQFTSATTCYSGLRRTTCQRFATETHAFSLSEEEEQQHNNENVFVVTGGPLPHPPSTEQTSGQRHNDPTVAASCCVGHDACKVHQVVWDLFSFLNSTEMKESPTPASASEATSASNTTVTQDSTTGGTSGHARPLSAASRPSTTSMDAALHTSYDDIVLQEEGTAVDDEPTPKAWLVLQGMEAEQVARYTARLSFRPLSPSVMHSPSHNGILVWVGSADDAELRCYVPVQDLEPKLHPLRLSPHDAFALSSHVMAIESLVKGDCHYLALGCQDGTIRLVNFAMQGRTFANVQENTFFVDGPILSLSLTKMQDGSVNVLAGSICGFVCQLSHRDGVLDGPTMVAEGLYNGRLEVDDPVLAVDLYDDRVAAGTQAGQCFVWERQRTDKNNQKEDSERPTYELQWRCQLPHPVHGVVQTPETLLVTTKKTVHVFRRRQSKLYSATRAKHRLESMLAQREISATPPTESDIIVNTNTTNL